MIDRIEQVDGNNSLTVYYKSGVKRRVGLLDHTYALTKTQREFMKKATIKRIDLIPWTNTASLFVTVWQIEKAANE